MVIIWCATSNNSGACPSSIYSKEFSYSELCKKRKSGLIWLSRPLNTYLAIWANFGPIWANISQRGWGTPTFFWSPRLYLPIGTWKRPNFCWGIFFYFGLGSKSQETPVDTGKNVKNNFLILHARNGYFWLRVLSSKSPATPMITWHQTMWD